MGISEEKSALRTRYRRERNERYIEHSFQFLAASPEIANARYVASYMSYNDEPDTSQLMITHPSWQNSLPSQS
jgi:5-formyltetrahydrofolate cyclo-ligase